MMISPISPTSSRYSPSKKTSSSSSSSSPFLSPFSKNQFLDSVRAKMKSMTVPILVDRDGVKNKRNGGGDGGDDDDDDEGKTPAKQKSSSSSTVVKRQKSSSSSSKSASLAADKTPSSPVVVRQKSSSSSKSSPVKRQKSSSSKSSNKSKSSPGPPPFAVISTKVFTFSNSSLSPASPPSSSSPVQRTSSRSSNSKKRDQHQHHSRQVCRTLSSPTKSTTVATAKSTTISRSSKRHDDLDPIISVSSPKKSTARGKRHSISHAPNNNSNINNTHKNPEEALHDSSPRVSPKTNKKIMGKRHSLSNTTTTNVLALYSTIPTSPPEKQKKVQKADIRRPLGKRHSLSHCAAASSTSNNSNNNKYHQPGQVVESSCSSKPSKNTTATKMGKRHSMSSAAAAAAAASGKGDDVMAAKVITNKPRRSSLSSTEPSLGSSGSENSNNNNPEEGGQKRLQRLGAVTPRRMSTSWLVGKLSYTARGGGVHATITHHHHHHPGGRGEQQQAGRDKQKVKGVVIIPPAEPVAIPASVLSLSPTKKSPSTNKQTAVVVTVGKHHTTKTATTTPKQKKAKDAVAAVAAAVRESAPSSTRVHASPRKKQSASTGKVKAAAAATSSPPLHIMSSPSSFNTQPKKSLSALPAIAAAVSTLTPSNSTTTNNRDENRSLDDSPTSATKTIKAREEETTRQPKNAESKSLGTRSSKKKNTKQHEASKEIAKDVVEEVIEEANADAKAPLPLSFVLASSVQTQGQQQKRRGSIDSRISAITECTFMSIGTSKIVPGVAADTPPPPPPPSMATTTRTDLRVRFGNPDLPRYNRQLRHDDCVVVPEFFGPEDNWWVYEQLIKEFDDLEQRSSSNMDKDDTSTSSSAGWKPCPAHLGKYLTWSSDPYKSQMFSDICDKVCEYFRIDQKTIGVELNWYKDCNDRQTPQRAETAFKQEENKDGVDDAEGTSLSLRNITVVVSFGAEREITLEMSNNRANEESSQNDKKENAPIASISVPQTNNGMFTIGRDVSIRFQHGLVEESDGLAAAVARHQILSGTGGDGGRIGILISGQAEDALEESGSPRRLPRTRRLDLGGNRG